MGKTKRSFGQMLVAQWPGFAGLLAIALGLLLIYEQRQTGVIRTRFPLLLIGVGVAGILYWAFANRNDDYNF